MQQGSQKTTDTASPVALVTGGGRPRVGNFVARDLAAHGYRIALHYHRSRGHAKSSRTEIAALGTECEVYRADVTDEQQAEQMISEVVARFGRIDVLVTTAAVWAPQPLESLTAQHLRQNFDLNVLGTFLPARAAGLAMVRQEEGGAIVTMGDWAIQRPYLDHAAYFVSKGAIPTLTRVLAVELGSRNPKVRVNCIHPGPVMFPPDTSEAHQRELVDSTLVKDANYPTSVAEAVRFLIQNQFVTGACLPVEGGRSIYSADEAVRTRSI